MRALIPSKGNRQTFEKGAHEIELKKLREMFMQPKMMISILYIKRSDESRPALRKHMLKIGNRIILYR